MYHIGAVVAIIVAWIIFGLIEGAPLLFFFCLLSLLLSFLSDLELGEACRRVHQPSERKEGGAGLHTLLSYV